MVGSNYVNLVRSMARRHLNQQAQFSWSEFFRSGRTLFFLTIILCLIGLFFVFESSTAEAFATFNDQYFLAKRQLIHFFIGLGALGVGYLMPSQVWRKLSPFAYVAGLVLLILVFVPGLGREINGAYRWLFIGPINLQPIEVMKFAVTIFFSGWMIQHQRLGPFLFLTLLPAALVMQQPDLGSTLILLTIAATLFFTSGGELKPFAGVGAVGIVLLTFLILLSPYRRERLITFFNPESDPLGASFHIRQITIALGNGGIFGQGIGNSKQKFSYIPEASTDSIFAIVAEEVGFVGSLLLMALFGLFVFVGYQIITHSKADLYGKMIGVGVLTWITMQAVLNISAVVALVPLTGVPLPFFSYGGTSLVMILFATGLLLHLTKPQKT